MNLRKILIIIFALASLAGAFAPFAVGAQELSLLSDSEKAWLAKHASELAFAPDPSYAPFEFFDAASGTTRGLAHEYVQAIEKKIGVTFRRVKAGSFSEILEMAKAKKVAIVNAATMTPQRSEYLLFTEPLVEVKNVILARRDIAKELTLEDLQGRKIAVVNGYAVTEHLQKNYPSYKYDIVPGDLSALLNAAYGLSDVAVVDMATSSYMCEREGITGLHVAGDAGYPIRLAIGSRRDMPELNAILNKALKSIGRAERDDIYRRWVHVQEANIFESPKFWVIVTVILSAFALVAVFGALWNRQLKRQVALRTADLRAAHEKLEAALEKAMAADRAKGMFLANMSHELRTPMNGIIGFATLLEMSELKTEQKKYVGIIKTASEGLLDLINDILDFSRLEANRITLLKKPFDIRAVIDDSISIVAKQFDKKKLALGSFVDPAIGATLVGDVLRVKQILLNLLTNAFKFTKTGTIRVDVRLVSRADTTVFVSLSVADDGCGIPADKLGEIFEMFHQLDDSSTRRHGGAGLGLSIVKGLAGLMGGRVLVESEVGKGSRFTVELPFECLGDADGSHETSAANAVVAPARQLKILLAEDDEASCEFIRFLSEKIGWKLVVAENGEKAVELFKKEKFDAVLMDGQMPEMNGFETIKKIRDLEVGCKERVPIVALTAYAMDGDREKFIAAGADEYVTKPVRDLGQLIRAVVCGGSKNKVDPAPAVAGRAK